MNQAPARLVLIPALLIGAPAAGQIVINNTTPGTYIDISATGTPLSLSDDGEVDITTTVGNVLLAAGTVRVGANGAVRFDGTGQSLGYTNQPIPSTSAFSGDRTLMPFWDDININSGQTGEIYWQEIAGTLIVQWEDAEFFGSTDTTTFQLQVHSTGEAFAQFLYQDVLQPRANGGGSATIGYQAGHSSADDLQWSFNLSNAVVDGDVVSVILSSVGQSFCLSVLNSTGSAAIISGSGSASVAANNLVLAAGPVPNQTGIFYYGPMTMQQVFGNGFRCVGGIVSRLPVTLASGNIMVTALDNTDPPNASGQITVGSTFHFQAWFRDPAAGGALFNLSDGLTVTFEL